MEGLCAVRPLCAGIQRQETSVALGVTTDKDVIGYYAKADEANPQN